MNKKKLFPIILELVGVAVVGTGIGVELVMHAEPGLIMITTGSVIVAAGGIVWGKFVKGKHL